MSNPLLDLSDLPRFDAIAPEHVSPAIDRLIEDARKAVSEAETVSPVTWQNFFYPLQATTERLARAWGAVQHLQAVLNTPALREAYNKNLPKMSAFLSQLGQNHALFAQYQALTQSPEFAAIDPVRRTAVEHILRDFRLGGVALTDEPKSRFRAIHQELSKLSSKFSENVLDATDSYALHIDDEHALTGLPAEVTASCRAAADKQGRGGYRLSLQMPCYQPVLTYAENRDIRRTLYLANIARASELGTGEYNNGPIIDRMLQLRAELASLLEFECWADYALAKKMADTPKQVLTFLRMLAKHAVPRAKCERAELEAFARAKLGFEKLEPWDLAWASEKLKQSHYAFSAQEVKQYFTESGVLSGLFGVVESLYGIRFEPEKAEVWHEDVRFYHVVDAHGNFLGQCYLDLYAREGKRSGAWMSEGRNRCRRQGILQTPVVYLTCNFGRGIDGKPATLTHDEVVMLFHEMGHGLHLLLTEVDELVIAGIRGVEWDAIELPSQFMENFAWEWENVRNMTSHVESGESIPRELFDRMLAAKNFQIGMHTVRQLELALYDMILHSEFDPSTGGAVALYYQVRKEVAVNPTPDCDRFPCQFGHIFAGSYPGGYYSYKWAEVLSADAYEAFAASPQNIAETGARFRTEVLSRGGSRPARENFRAFRGRDPDVSALLKQDGMLA
jgi:oligopeptidase A